MSNGQKSDWDLSVVDHKGKPVESKDGHPLYADVVMRGGVTSGVIYPRAIAEIAKSYRLKGVGGASAGAIGAALGAAAEFGRDHGGFEKLDEVPKNVKLSKMFRARWSTWSIFLVLKAAIGFIPGGRRLPVLLRVGAVLVALVVGFPVSTLLVLMFGLWVTLQTQSKDLLIAQVLLVIVVWVVVMLARIFLELTQSVPRNMFGICSGFKEGDKTYLTNWLSTQLNELAGLDQSKPLVFGQLWSGTKRPSDGESDRVIDLRMVVTCLSQARPYEMPFRPGDEEFYYDPKEWAKLFPAEVMDYMRDSNRTGGLTGSRRQRRMARIAAAAEHEPSLLRLPESKFLPVVVATRMSLSFPVLISAVPMWRVRYKSNKEMDAERSKYPDREISESAFEKVWFNDGGLSSNFPIHMFDSPMPKRPTFAINLGRFPDGVTKASDQMDENFDYAKDNSDNLANSTRTIKQHGPAAVSGFAGASLSTARDWHDNSYLSAPGYRDRVVRVLQTKKEGGINLYMNHKTIDDLALRGQAAAKALVDQFREGRYPASTKEFTGWQNHRWVRYRSLIGALPAFLLGYREGYKSLGVPEPVYPGSYPLRGADQLAHDLSNRLRSGGLLVEKTDLATLDALSSAPRPMTVIRRVPEV